MIVLTDCRIDKKCESALVGHGFEVIKLPSFDGLDAPVSAHPDMLLFVGKGRLICHERYYKIAKAEIDLAVKKSGLALLIIDERWEREYPCDVILTAAPIENRVICNKKHVCRAIAELYGEEGVIDTKQGYSKCASVVVGNSGVITADPSVARAVKKAGIDVLELSGSYTRLDGYDTGFIGGASGDDGEHIFFAGNIDTHPESESIKRFCLSHSREVISLSDESLYDYGTLIFI